MYKKTAPASLLGQDLNSCGTTRLDAPAARPLCAYNHMRTFVHGGPHSVAHTPGCRRFLIALGSPFDSGLFAALPAPAALWRKGTEPYSLFLNGFKCNFECIVAPRPAFVNTQSPPSASRPIPPPQNPPAALFPRAFGRCGGGEEKTLCHFDVRFPKRGDVRIHKSGFTFT